MYCSDNLLYKLDDRETPFLFFLFELIHALPGKFLLFNIGHNFLLNTEYLRTQIVCVNNFL